MHIDDSTGTCRHWNPGGAWITKDGEVYKDTSLVITNQLHLQNMM